MRSARARARARERKSERGSVLSERDRECVESKVHRERGICTKFYFGYTQMISFKHGISRFIYETIV